MSLEQCITDWTTQPRGPEPWQWDPTWLPIGHYQNPDRITVDCTPPQQRMARLCRYTAEEGGFGRSDDPVVTGMATVVRWWLDALDEGHIVYNADADIFEALRWADIPADRRRTGLI